MRWTAVLLLLVLAACADDEGTEITGPPDGTETFTIESADHTEDDVDYEQSPPVGGPHHPVWQNCGVYNQPIRDEHAVHSLEHGAVWLTYRPGAPAETIAALTERADSDPHVLISPYPGQEHDIVATAWGAQYVPEGPDDLGMLVFAEFYSQNPDGPEPGAPCDGGTDETA